MLRKAKTPLDFSKEQIKNLKQRNSLTQQLLVTTDSIGKAHVEIPIRVASERNRQYMLIKNEGVEGGWILGIRDDGTAAKPIEIDQDPVKVEEDDDSDMDMEEVEISQAEPDPDLREYQRANAIQALSKRRPQKKLNPTKKVNRKPKSKPLFYPEPDDPEAQMVDDDLDDEVLVAAIQASVEEQEEQEALDLQRAMELSSAEGLNTTNSYSVPTNVGASSSRSTLDNSLPLSTPAKASSHKPPTYTTISDDEDLYASPTRLETALAIAGASPSKKPTSRASKNALTYSFGAPSALLQDPPASVLGDKTTPRRVSFNETRPFTPPVSSNSKKPSPLSTAVQREKSITPIRVSLDEEALVADIPSAPLSSNVSTADDKAAGSSRVSPIPVDDVTNSDEDDDMEEVVAPPIIHSTGANETERPSVVSGVYDAVDMPEAEMGRIQNAHSPQGAVSDVTPLSNTLSRDEPSPHPSASREFIPTGLLEDPSDSSDEDSDADLWSAVPSLPVNLDTAQPEASQHPSSSNAKTQEITEDWDAAQEMDPQAEEGEFVRFMSQVRGKDLDSVRREIDDEIRSLNQQRKVAMRDSEDITQQMISQIMMMLRLFGIPYITAPMEAEAQCAELLSLELVDGIITDDSDVFLFGGARVFKNMFNQSKTVECFLLSDLERELGLERDKLIRLAYLLGSDYTDGLPGVGPVVAMELLTEFPDLDGLHKFKEWWRKVQSGRDKQDESANKFRKRFKKRFKELFLADDWPNPAVRDAYYHPTVDHSDEPFKWGLPDLDALRDFFGAELGWSQSKVDDLLLPIIQKMNKRTQQGALNKQGNLTAFFDVPAGGGVSRKRQAYSSKRLQQVVSDFRKKQRAEGDAQSRGDSSEAEPEEDTSRPKKKRKASETPSTSSSRKKNEASRSTGRGRGRGRGRGGKAARGRKAAKSKAREGSDSSGDEFQEGSTVPAEVIPDQPLSVELRPRPKPRMRRKAADVEANDIASE
ncbi:hypothetical protein QCA50_005761 [Cerrena zonata]|uniref:XPG-I domain-containing protein n=1 Tax=Cerrena zonata TaxID=2478898 RepID=A0AAW0GG30_9APHY